MKSRFIYCLIVVGLLMQSVSIRAEEARPLQDNVAVEQQVQRLSEELRCLVCQNQTLADSSSGLAEDLRQEIREMAAKGMSDKAIVDYLVVRYGDFVRYRPPLKLTTVMLWFGPFALLLAGGVGLFVTLRKREKVMTDAPLNAEEARRVSELLDKES